MALSFKWNRSIKSILRDCTKGDEGRLFLANEFKKIMDPFVPANNLVLAQNVRTYVENGTGIIEYMSPYARYQFEGKLMVDPETGKGAFTDGEGNFWSRPGVAKVLTNKELNYSHARHMQATSHWDEAAKVSGGDTLAAAYQRFIKK